MDFTINQWAIIALVFILGWLLGLASRCADMALSWCTATGSEPARLRFSGR